MKSRLLVVFYSDGDAITLRHTIDTFLTCNASELSQFKIVIHLTRPDSDTVELFKSLYLSRTPYLTAGRKPPCISCIMKRHKVRYGVVIPPGYHSVKALVPYLDEINHTLTTVPNLTHIRLTSDTDLTNRLTLQPMIYRYHTRHIMVGNGNLGTYFPVLIKVFTTPSSATVSGVLKPVVFTKEE